LIFLFFWLLLLLLYLHFKWTDGKWNERNFTSFVCVMNGQLSGLPQPRLVGLVAGGGV